MMGRIANKKIVYGFTAAYMFPYFYLVTTQLKLHKELTQSIMFNVSLCVIAFLVSYALIPLASHYMHRRGMLGIDIKKRGLIRVPEPLGIVVGIVFLVLVIAFFGCARFLHFNFIADSTLLVQYYSALTSICFMILIGFVDDVLNVPWRVRLVLPLVAILPLLIAYDGDTTILIPKPLIPYVGLEMLDLGWMYKLYMCLLALFCTNSISLYAGINGLEVGQTIIIASAILIHNIMQIGASTDNSEYQQAHLFSIHLIQPLIATSLSLLYYNWYPSYVFVGDTYTYFAGMTLAVVGILGHYSELLLLFFAPQVVNLILSLPQIAGIIHCPRHRIPRFDNETGLLTGTDDGTLLNYCLRWFGSMSEQSLCIVLLSLQAITCGFGLFVWRHREVMPFLTCTSNSTGERW